MFTNEYDSFRTLLINERRKRHLTQAEIARRLSRRQSFVSKYERGERRLDLIEFLQVAKALEIDPCAFLKHLEGSSPRSH